MKPFADMIKEALDFHRAEIARLERALMAYNGETVPTPVSRVPFAGGLITRLPSNDVQPRQRVSKYERLFRAFEDEHRALNNDDMILIAAENGFRIDRSNMRSIVYTQKSLGRVRPVGDGYVWGKEPTASSQEEAGGHTPPANLALEGDAQQHEGASVDHPGVGGI